PGLCGVTRAESRDDEIKELKKAVESMQKTINEQNKKIQEIEKAQAKAPPPPSPAAEAAETEGVSSPVKERGAFNDQQEAAPRPDDLTLDPKYRGFTRIPNTKVMIKFNAKPRVDMTYDNQNAGDDNRFITAKIPVDGDPTKGGKPVFNINAKGSQLRIDVRAPEVAGAPRFYYENDFYGSGGGEFPYRVRHLYGQIYNIIVGQTYSVFEDPDVWPDTVDYEGPNSAIFARRPLARYELRLEDEWQMNFGIEQPEAEVDTTTQSAASGRNSAPDGGVNVRWERSDVGHVQFASILRDIGVRGSTHGNQDVFGWGLNLSGGFDVFDDDSMQAQLTYGEGLFRFSNDDFVNNDAAFDKHGNLEAIPYFGGMFGYTHRWGWNEHFRSTASYGYVHLDNTSVQSGTAYHETHYASLNLMWQLRERLSIGLEELYGYHTTKDHSNGDAFRTTVGLVYSIF
ncbi:MAG TPA: DcaP family trimeric outer membrane transporter, partial [Candidatus Acidoferrales bacterium]|nr:DcaP family trimeric outer membrane transporter [Candidatus Acidoferrales bacterium]